MNIESGHAFQWENACTKAAVKNRGLKTHTKFYGKIIESEKEGKIC